MESHTVERQEDVPPPPPPRRKGNSNRSNEEVEKNGFVLTPGRFVGSKKSTDSDENFQEKISQLICEMKSTNQSARSINGHIEKSLSALGFNE